MRKFSSSPSSGRKVKFPEELEDLEKVVCILPSLADYTKEDVKAIWFDASEFQFFKGVARTIAKECLKYGYGDALDDTFGCSRDTSTSKAQQHLNSWAKLGHSRRGLERWTNRKHGEIRKREQSLAIKTVLQCQQEQKLKHGGVDANMLAIVSEEYTMNARIFAQMIGEADALSVSRSGISVPNRLSVIIMSKSMVEWRKGQTNKSCDSSKNTDDSNRVEIEDMELAENENDSICVANHRNEMTQSQHQASFYDSLDLSKIMDVLPDPTPRAA